MCSKNDFYCITVIKMIKNTEQPYFETRKKLKKEFIKSLEAIHNFFKLSEIFYSPNK